MSTIEGNHSAGVDTTTSNESLYLAWKSGLLNEVNQELAEFSDLVRRTLEEQNSSDKLPKGNTYDVMIQLYQRREEFLARIARLTDFFKGELNGKAELSAPNVLEQIEGPQTLEEFMSLYKTDRGKFSKWLKVQFKAKKLNQKAAANVLKQSESTVSRKLNFGPGALIAADVELNAIWELINRS